MYQIAAGYDTLRTAVTAANPMNTGLVNVRALKNKQAAETFACKVLHAPKRSLVVKRCPVMSLNFVMLVSLMKLAYRTEN